MIGLYTGARVNEICQMNPQCDIHEEDGIWVFDFNETTEADEGVEKSVKTPGSTRKVPVHSTLIKMGLLQYVDSVKQAGGKRLFPKWEPREGRASAQAEAWFRVWLGTIGLRDDTPGQRIAGMHAFRHTIHNHALNNDIRHMDKITGHVEDGSKKDVSKVVEGYQGEFSLENRKKAIEQVRFDINPPMPVSPAPLNP